MCSFTIPAQLGQNWTPGVGSLSLACYKVAPETIRKFSHLKSYEFHLRILIQVASANMTSAMMLAELNLLFNELFLFFRGCVLLLRSLGSV